MGPWAGRKCYEYFIGRNAPCPTCDAAEVFKAKKTTVKEGELDDGSNRFTQVTSIPYQDKSGEWLLAQVNVDVTKRKKAEENLLETQRQIEFILGAAKTGLDIIDSQFNLRYVDPESIKTFGPWTGRKCYNYYMGRDKPCPTCNAPEVLASKRVTVKEDKLFGEKDIYTHVTSIPYQDKNGEWLVAQVSVDVTEHKKLEVQLIQAQKMEAVGRLAGGIAHDFNNMLNAILGYAELAMGKLTPSHPLHRYVQGILNAAQHAADITRQLLAFARKQTIAPKVIDLNQSAENMLNMLRRLIGENIDLLWKPGKKPCLVKIDPSQIDQILTNLCVNARDAIADVGKVTIETENVVLDETFCARHQGAVAGEFVMLAVSDDGCGMDKEMLSGIFEPFFTTKKTEQNVGMGLAMVYGIVKQNNGFVSAYSEPDKGTTIKIYLPRQTDKAEAIKAGSDAVIPPSRGETVLLVEDELIVMQTSQMLLEKLGYQVLAASTPDQAMKLAKEHADRIHLLITDVIMPEMNGRELASKLHTLYPDIKILFTSGYTANVIAHRGVLDKDIHFIEKPFSMKALAVKIREVIDQK